MEQIYNTKDIYKEGADSFIKASKLKPNNMQGSILNIHDSVSHKAIPASLYKKVGGTEQPLTNYLPINAKGANNRQIEEIARGVEGWEREDTDLYKIGRALRKKKLSRKDKAVIETGKSNRYSQIISDVVDGKTKPNDIDWEYLRSRYQYESNTPRIPRKTKGTKPLEATIEEKKQNLKQKYGIR